MPYRERVWHERWRIKQHMLSLSASEQQAWSKTRTTRRLTIGNTNPLVVWSPSCKEPLYTLAILQCRFDFKVGLIATLAKLDRYLNVIQSFEVDRNPVHLGDDVFIALDTVEPFEDDCGEVAIRLLAFSGAGPKGYWAEGTVVGTEQEFNLK